MTSIFYDYKRFWDAFILLLKIRKKSITLTYIACVLKRNSIFKVYQQNKPTCSVCIPTCSLMTLAVESMLFIGVIWLVPCPKGFASEYKVLCCAIFGISAWYASKEFRVWFARTFDIITFWLGRKEKGNILLTAF